MENYVKTKHGQQPYIKFSKGFATPVYGCKPTPALSNPNNFPGWNADWMISGLDTKATTDASDEVCAVWIDHKVLVDQRDTFANFFHDSEDFFNVFLGMAVLEWSVGDTQVLLTDLYPKGGFWPMWEKVFSGPRTPALDAWAIKQQLGHAQLGTALRQR